MCEGTSTENNVDSRNIFDIFVSHIQPTLSKINLYLDSPPKFTSLVRYIIEKIPWIQTMLLVKTIYLLELEYLIRFGEKFSEIPIVRITWGQFPKTMMCILHLWESWSYHDR